MKAIVYAAKSTADQHNSLPEQVRDCLALADCEGYEVAARFEDEDETAYKGNRGPGLKAAMARAEELAPCALIVQHTSRLARGNVKDARSLSEVAIWAIKHDVTIKSVENPLPDDNLLLMSAVYGSQDYEYSRRLGTSVRKGLIRGTRERGQWYGRPPDGYRITHTDNGRALIIDADRQPTIERLFAIAIKQQLHPAAIGRALNRLGLLQAERPFRHNGTTTTEARPWRARDVKRLLVNPIYAGIIRYGGEEVRGKVPAYITTEQHEWLVAKHGAVRPRAMGPKIKGKAAKRYALSGLAVCGKCGARMQARTRARRRKDGTQQRQYVCANNRGAGLCDFQVDADWIDVQFLAGIDALLRDYAEWRQQLLDTTAHQRAEVERALNKALTELEEANIRAARAQQDYEAALDTGDEDLKALAVAAIKGARKQQPKLTREVEHHRLALTELEDSAITEHVEGMARRLQERDPEMLNDALRAELESVVIAPDEAGYSIIPHARRDTSFGRYAKLWSAYQESWEQRLAEAGDTAAALDHAKLFAETFSDEEVKALEAQARASARRAKVHKVQP